MRHLHNRPTFNGSFDFDNLSRLVFLDCISFLINSTVITNYHLSYVLDRLTWLSHKLLRFLFSFKMSWEYISFLLCSQKFLNLKCAMGMGLLDGHCVHYYLPVLVRFVVY